MYYKECGAQETKKKIQGKGCEKNTFISMLINVMSARAHIVRTTTSEYVTCTHRVFSKVHILFINIYLYIAPYTYIYTNIWF